MTEPTLAYAVTAGKGRLMDYGVTDNQHTVDAKFKLAALKAGVLYPEARVQGLSSDQPKHAETGK